MAEQYEIIGTATTQNVDESLMVSVSQDDQFSTLPPGPVGPQAVPVSSLPPGPAGPQAVPVPALPPGPSGPQAVPVAVQYSSSQCNQQASVPVQQQAQYQNSHSIQPSQQQYQTVNPQNHRNETMQQQYLIHQEQQQSQPPHQPQQQLQYQIVVQQPGQDQHQQSYPTQPQQVVQQAPPPASQSYQAQQQYIHVQQQPSVIQIPRQVQPRQAVSQQQQYQYQVQDVHTTQNHQHQQQIQHQPHSQQAQHGQQQSNPQQQFVVMQVQQPQQQQQVVSYQYQQTSGVQQHHQPLQQSQQRYIIQQQSGIQGNSPSTPQRFFIKSPHQGSPQRHITPPVQPSNQTQQQFSTPTSNPVQQQPNSARQPWRPQQQTIRGQIMQSQQVPLQQGIPQKRTIMMQGNVIRLQPNSSFQGTGQPRMMQIQQQPNAATLVQPGTQPVSNQNQQQYPNMRMSNGVQGSPQVIRTTGVPRVTSQVSVRQMAPNSPQGQFIQQPSMIHQQQQSIQTQQQTISNQRLQSPMTNQWENRPQVSLQAGQQPLSQRPAVPQQQSFVMQMRPPGPAVPRPSSQVVQSNQHNEIAYDVEHVFNENGREVRKMPIKLGNDTFWVDVQEDNKTGDLNSDGTVMQEDSIMLNLDMEGNGALNISKTGAQGSIDASTPVSSEDQSLQQVRPPIQTDWKSNKNRLTDELKSQIVKECCEDLISPAELASRHGVNVVQIRKIVKDAGQKLPTKYKITNSKNISTSLGQVPTTVGTINSMPQITTISGTQNQLPVHGQQQLIPSSSAGPFRQVIVTDASGSKIHSISATNQTSGLTLPQKPTPPGITLVKPVVTPASIAARAQDCSNTYVDKKITISTGDQSYKGKIIPGKLAVCKNCGGYSSDFNRCSRCRKPIPEDCKTVDDDTKVGKSSKGDFLNKMSAERARDVTKDGLRNIRIQHKGRKRHNHDEPECIALSSDEDGEDEDDELGSRTGDDEIETDESGNKEDLKDAEVDARLEKLVAEVSAIVDVSDNQGKTYASLQCRSIRIGSYKSMPKEKAAVTENAIQIKVPAIGNQNELVVLTIKKSDINQIYAHFGRTMPLLFIFCNSFACARIRSALKMASKNTGLWFDVECPDETMKRLTILPDKMTDDTKNVMVKYYGDLIKELDSKTANEILVRSSPKDAKIRQLAGQISKDSVPLNSIRSIRTEPQPIQKYCQYPPTGSSSVSVTNEDYYCLEEESFLNDTTIDFYFKWLQFSLLKQTDRDRTHIFSTFFYKRLTTRPPKQKNKVHPVEDDPNLSAADKRYERVKRWTKKINIFEKDFIVVPINEHSHWFVAVICFPGKEGCWSAETNQLVDEPASQKHASHAQQLRKKRRPKDSAKRVMQIGSTSIIPLKGAGGAGILEKFGLDDDQSDRDEAEASDDDIFNPDDEELLSDTLASSIVNICKDDANPSDSSSKSSRITDSPKEASPDGHTDINEDQATCDIEKTEGSEKITEFDKSPQAIQNTVEAESPGNENISENGNDVEDNNSITSNAAQNSDNTNKSTVRIKQPCILIFDSLHSGSRAKVVATLRDYVSCEYKAKMGHTGQVRIFNKESFRGCCPKVPQQPNFSDCGIYLLQYIEAFFEAPVESFSLPITTLKHWFPKEVVKHKRANIAEIIRDLATKQNPEKKFNFPTLEFVGIGSGYTDDEEDDTDDTSNTKEPRLLHLIPPNTTSSLVTIQATPRSPKSVSISASDVATDTNNSAAVEEKINCDDSKELENDVPQKEARVSVLSSQKGQIIQTQLSTTNPVPTNTTMIHLGGTKRPQESENCVVRSNLTPQQVTTKVTQISGLTQPRVISLPSPSLAARNITTARFQNLSQNTRVPASVQPQKTSLNTLVKSGQPSNIKTINNPQMAPVKLYTTPTGNMIQPVQMTVNASVTSSGPTGHTVILKKAGKIETFPVPQLNSTNVPISICHKSREHDSTRLVMAGNRLGSTETSSTESAKVVVPKLTHSSMENKGNITSAPPSRFEGTKDFSNGVIMRENQLKPNPGLRNSECNVEHLNSKLVISSTGNTTQAAPDSTSSSLRLYSGNSEKEDGQGNMNANEANNSFSYNQKCVSQTKNLNTQFITGFGDRKASEVNTNYTEANIKSEPDSSNNSSRNVNSHKSDSQMESSNSSATSLKRTLSSTMAGGGDYLNAADDQKLVVSANSNLYHEKGNVEAKKPKL